MNMNQFSAVQNDGEDVLGKILYYSLSSILIDWAKLKEICQAEGFAYTHSQRVAPGDAFRRATGDIYTSHIFGSRTVKVYCRDNKSRGDTISRELVKETLDTATNEYKKLANLTYNQDMGFSYSDLVYDSDIDPLVHCQKAEELFELHQSCAGRKQIETLLQSFVDSLKATKLMAHGKMYFIPRSQMHRLGAFEDLFVSLESANLITNVKRPPMDVNSMYVVNDAKQREKMAAAFHRALLLEIAEYQERATHFIQTGCQSVAVMDRWVSKIDALEAKRREYEAVLMRELNEAGDELQALGYLSQELQIRANGIRKARGG